MTVSFLRVLAVPDEWRQGLLSILILGLVWGGALGARAQTTPFDLTRQADGARSVTTADIDNDGRLDVLAALQEAHSVVWFRNLPDETFGDQRVITSSDSGATAVETADVDGDGDQDVVVAAYRDDTVAWYENQGPDASSRFAPKKTIDGQLEGVTDLYVSDFDEDGDPDVLAAAFLGDRLVWYENQRGDDPDLFASATRIGEEVDGPRAVLSANLDGEGTPDILFAAEKDGTIGWFKGGTFGGQRVLSQSAASPRSVAADDVDDDGDVDVVGVHDEAVVWFENQGGGAFGTAQTIADISQGQDVRVADLDGDGDSDVLFASGGDDTIAWIENRFRQEEAFAAPEPLTTQANGAIGVHAADLDGDDFLDVLGTAWWDDRVVAFLNRGLGAPPPPDSMTATTYREEAARMTWRGRMPADGAGYRLYRATDSFATPEAATAVGPDPITDTTYTDTGLSGGEVYHYRVLAVDSSGNAGLLSASDTVQPDLPEPVAPKEVSIELEGNNPTLQWTANSEFDLAGYRVYRARSPFSSSTGATRVYSGGTEQVRYTDTLETGGTVYYRVAAVDEEDNESRLSASNAVFYYPDRLSVNVQRSFSGDFRAEEYRLVSMPGTVDRSIGSVAEGEPGTDWMALWDSGAAEDPFVRFDGSETFNFRPGRGFWLLGRSSWSVRDTVSTVALRGDSMTVIDLHDGWNIISNPLGKTVQWRAVDAAHEDTLQALWQFRQGFERTVLFRSGQRGEAYYFLNRTGLDSLRIPYPGAPPASVRDKGASEHAASTLALTAVQDSRRAAARAQLRSDAREGLDAYDQVAPTVRFDPIRLVFEAPTDDPAPRRAHLAEEARPPAGPGQAFDLTLEAEPDASVQIRASGLDALPWDRAVLVHEAAGRRYDLHEQSTVSVETEGDEIAFTLRVGTDAFVTNGRTGRDRPETLTLGEPHPNPFQIATSISYALPEAAEVRAVVYDLLGRRVATLVDAPREAGSHQLSWNGEAEDGTTVASGIYVVRVRAEGKQRTRKLVRVR